MTDRLTWPLPNACIVTSTSDWVEEVCRRALYIKRLSDRAIPGSAVPSWRPSRPEPTTIAVIDISALCRPEALSLDMYVYLKEDIESVPAIGADEMLLKCIVTDCDYEDEVVDPRPDGVYLTGAYMLGGIWDASDATMLPHPTGSTLPRVFVPLEKEVRDGEWG